MDLGGNFRNYQGNRVALKELKEASRSKADRFLQTPNRLVNLPLTTPRLQNDLRYQRWKKSRRESLLLDFPFGEKSDSSEFCYFTGKSKDLKSVDNISHLCNNGGKFSGCDAGT